MDKDLFGNYIIDVPKIKTFHDESGNISSDRWFLTGILWIKDEFIELIVKSLKDIRNSENYYSKIHYCDLPKSFNGEYGAKARVAMKWFSEWFGKWANQTWFNIFAVDTKHKEYQYERFHEDFHAYNKFTVISFKSGLSWHFRDIKKIELEIYSDDKDRRAVNTKGNGKDTDNFEEYLLHQIIRESQAINYKGPELVINKPVKCINCNNGNEFSPEQELLQLTDIILGAVNSALCAKSIQETKLWFGKEMSELIQDVKKTPWNQKYKLHRRFSLSYFPDLKGKVYDYGELKIKEKGAIPLFEGKNDKRHK